MPAGGLRFAHVQQELSLIPMQRKDVIPRNCLGKSKQELCVVLRLLESESGLGSSQAEGWGGRGASGMQGGTSKF